MKGTERGNAAFFREYALFRNPILCETVGLAPVLAVAVSVKTGLLLSAMMFVSLIINEALTKVLFGRFSAPVRMLMYFLTGSVVSVSVMAVTDGLLPTLSAELGLFLPLTAVSSFTAVHCERYVAQASELPAAKHAVFSALGYTVVTLIISAVRELAAYGTLFGLQITLRGTSKAYLMPFFALLLMGFMSAGLKTLAGLKGGADIAESAFMEHSVLVDGESASEDMMRFERLKTAFAERKNTAETKKAENKRIRAENKRLADETKKARAEEKAEQKRLEKERIERERLEKERAERERLEKERAERERLEKERIERERLEKERAERERLEKERIERERLEKERIERERLEKERIERERLEKERIERERLEKERAERERLEKERIERERLEKERIERERLEKERIERERLEKERIERERLEKERKERERLEKEKREAEERARAARAEIEERNKRLRREEELRREEMRKRSEEAHAVRMSAEEEKLRMREQAEKARLVRKAVLQEERRRKKLGMPSMTSSEIDEAFKSGSVRVYGRNTEKRASSANPYIMPLSDDGEEKMQ